MTLSVKHNYNIATFKNICLNFWGIPKSGHTTIKHILLRANDNEKFDNWQRHNSNKTADGWVHHKCEYVTPDQARQNGFKNFAVVRDPIQRFYSMYNTITRISGDVQGSERFNKEFFNFFAAPTFFAFLDLLEKFPDGDRNIHHRSQSSYCQDDDIIKLKLSSVSSTIIQIHPMLTVDVKLNDGGHDKYESDEIINNRIREVFPDDFVMFEGAI